VALPTPQVRASTEVHGCSMRLLDGLLWNRTFAVRKAPWWAQHLQYQVWLPSPLELRARTARRRAGESTRRDPASLTTGLGDGRIIYRRRIVERERARGLDMEEETRLGWVNAMVLSPVVRNATGRASR